MYWQELKPNKERVAEPVNPLFDNPFTPTVAERDFGKDFINHDFREDKFDIPLFKAATDKKVKRGRNGCIMFHNDGYGCGGKKVPVYKHVHCTKSM